MTLVLLLFLWAQLIVLPIQLLLYVGLRQENKRRDATLKAALKVLGIIAISKGNKNR